jgi:hypothetical protein
MERTQPLGFVAHRHEDCRTGSAAASCHTERRSPGVVGSHRVPGVSDTSSFSPVPTPCRKEAFLRSAVNAGAGSGPLVLKASFSFLTLFSGFLYSDAMNGGLPRSAPLWGERESRVSTVPLRVSWARAVGDVSHQDAGRTRARDMLHRPTPFSALLSERGVARLLVLTFKRSETACAELILKSCTTMTSWGAGALSGKYIMSRVAPL